MDIVESVVVNKLTGQQQLVLDYLQGNPHEKFYLRELARQLTIDAGNLSRVLGGLADLGYLDKTKEGNLVYFSLRNVDKPGKVARGGLTSDRRVTEYLKKAEPEMVKFCQNLIRTPSVSGVDPEEKISGLIAEKAKQLGLVVKVAAKDRRRPNLVIDLDEEKLAKKPYFLLVGHMDTIGIGEIDNWHYYPFSGHSAGGNIYGRGAIDMKAGIVAEMYTQAAIKDLGIDLPVSPRILLVSNEEGGSAATSIFDQGMEFLVGEGYVAGVGAIYGYGGSYNVGIGHRGVLRIKVTTKGEAVHTGSIKWQEGEKGANAVTAMAEVLLALENLELPRVEHPCFVRHGNVITPGTMILHGGSAVSTVPDRCESVVEVRYLPGLKIDEVYEGIKGIIEGIATKRGVGVELARFVNIPAVCLSPTEKIVDAVSQAAEAVYGQQITARGYGPANESFMLIKRGIPTVVFGPLGGRAHSDNEFVEVASLAKTVSVYLGAMEAMGEDGR